MQIKMISIEDIKPYANNPRNNQKAIKEVAESIKQFGFKVPIVLDSNFEIITGHTRVLAAKKLKMLEVPAIIADDLNPDQIKAFRLVDNKVAEIAEWDVEKLMVELNEIELDLSMFDLYREKTMSDVNEDTYEIEVPKVPKSKLGDIYKLGKHRLICGDSTDPEVIEKLMDYGIADCILTDPPYNVNYESPTTKDKIINDDMDKSVYAKFISKAIQVAAAHLKKGGAFYIWHSDTETRSFMNACERADLEIKQTLIWNKSAFVLGRKDYQQKHEPCFYGWKPGAAHYFVDDRTFTTVLNYDRPLKSEQHPTMKPVQMIAQQIMNSTKSGDIILDVFGGSGTTLVASEQLGRTCYMAELDPKYADVIIERWEHLTGLKAEKMEV